MHQQGREEKVYQKNQYLSVIPGGKKKQKRKPLVFSHYPTACSALKSFDDAIQQKNQKIICLKQSMMQDLETMHSPHHSEALKAEKQFRKKNKAVTRVENIREELINQREEVYEWLEDRRLFLEKKRSEYHQEEMDNMPKEFQRFFHQLEPNSSFVLLHQSRTSVLEVLLDN